jgi:flagellar protein FliO/FliZ
MNYQPDLISTSLRMFAALAVILGGLLIALYYTKRKFRGESTGSKGKLIRVLGNTYIGMKKHISLVEVPGSILVLGITNDNISLLTKIEDDEIVEKLLEHEGDISASFSEQLHRLSSKFREHKDKK